MRVLLMASISVAMLKICGAGDAPAAAPPTAEAPSGSFAMRAEHGGTVIRAEDHWVELVPKSDGTLEAYVADAAGEPVPVAGTVVNVQVRGTDQRPHAVSLRWNPDAYRFEGRLEGTTIAEGPTEVIVVVAGRPRRATAPRLVIVEVPAPERAEVLVAPREPRRSTVIVEHPAPRPGVVVVAPPPPRPSIVFVPPQPPGVVVHVDDDDRHHRRGHHGRGHHRGRRHHDDDHDDDHDERFDE